MPVDIARVFAESWEIIKERWLLLLGIWLAFFAINIVYSMVGGAVTGGSFYALAAATSFGDSELLMGGLGVGAIALVIVYYLGMMAIFFGQQCGMSALSSPLRRISFGDGIKQGLLGGLSFVVISVLLFITFFIFSLAYTLFAAVLSLAGSAGAALAGLLLLPAMIYFMIRFSVIVPVVAVDGVLNPFKAMSETWRITGGRALAILAVMAVILGVGLFLIGLPIGLLFGAIFTGSPDAAIAGVLGAFLVGFFVVLPLFLVFSIVAMVIITCLHAQLSDRHVDEAAETFA